MYHKAYLTLVLNDILLGVFQFYMFLPMTTVKQCMPVRPGAAVTTLGYLFLFPSEPTERADCKLSSLPIQ